MDDFELDFSLPDFDLGFDEPEDDGAEKEKHPIEYMPDYQQKRARGLDNLFHMNAPGGNEWGIPETEPMTENLYGIEWISFWDKSKYIGDPENMGVHFFIEDFQFKSIWEKPDKHLDFLRNCRAVVTPDFSVYTDMPKAQQLWNHYRRQWCAKYWQDNGVNIVSCVTWDLLDPQPWSLYGIPNGTQIARSWVNKNGMKQERLTEFLKIIDRLEPTKIFIKCSPADERELRKHFNFEVIPPVRW